MCVTFFSLQPPAAPGQGSASTKGSYALLQQGWEAQMQRAPRLGPEPKHSHMLSAALSILLLPRGTRSRSL